MTRNHKSPTANNVRRPRGKAQTPAEDVDLRDPLRQPLKDAVFVVFDIETTGGNPQKNGITEIYAAKVQGGKLLDHFYSLIDPKIPVPPIVRRMTGINNKMLQGQPVIAEVMPKILDFIGQHVVVSHNTVGDLHFIKYFAQQVCKVDFDNFFLCTHLLAQKLLPEAPKKSLSGLMEHLAIDMGDKHRAEADALATKVLFERLCELLHGKGISTILEAVRFQGDLESSMRVGWDVPRSAMQNIPNGPGLFYVFDSRRRMIFASSAQSLQAEIKKLANFRQIPKSLVRHVIIASNIQYDRYPNVLAAMLEETKVHVREGIAPALLHGRTVEALLLVQDDQGYCRLQVGPILPGTIAAFGPISDRKRAQGWAKSIAEILIKHGHDPQKFSPELVPTIVQALTLTWTRILWGLVARKPMAYAGGGKPVSLPASLALLWDLRKAPQWPHLQSLMDTNGVIVVNGEGSGQIVTYTVANCRVIGQQKVTGKTDEWQVPRVLSRQISRDLARASTVTPLMTSSEDLGVVNAVLWFIHHGMQRGSGQFIPASELAGS